jgi:hypothetical protein
MPRRPRDQLFTQSAVTRLLRAFQAAKCPLPCIKVTKDGLVAIPSAPGATPEAADHNPWLSDLDKVKQ